VPPPQQDARITRVLENFYKTSVLGQAARLGFTLAEVLITLGIIGIVAAITMPVLSAKIDEIVMINRLKSTYSIILNAINMRKLELGANDYSDVFPANTNGIEGAKVDLDGLVKYLKTVEVCAHSKAGCGGQYIVKYPQAINDGSGKNNYVQFGTTYRAILTNGALIWVQHRNTDGTCMFKYENCPRDENGNYIEGAECTYYYSGQCAEIFIDLNGPKGKNQFGYDCFAFTVQTNKFSQTVGYGSIDDTIRTGKLQYKNYTPGGDFKN